MRKISDIISNCILPKFEIIGDGNTVISQLPKQGENIKEESKVVLLT